MGNSWGERFKVSSFGESHGKAIGVVIDGCPAGLELGESDIQPWLDRRRPGSGAFVSPRQESDKVEILSGVFEGKTTGAPIAMLIANRDVQSEAYEPTKAILRPGHSSFTYWKKWGHVDWRGGGRSSARETASRVCAGAVAAKLLSLVGVEILSFITQIGAIQLPSRDLPRDLPRDLKEALPSGSIGGSIDGLSAKDPFSPDDLDSLDLLTCRQKVYQSAVRCPDPILTLAMERYLGEIQALGDSIGGVIETWIDHLPIGLGAPVFDRLDARLAYAMLSLPASRAFSMDEGFSSVKARGSEFNDSFAIRDDSIAPSSNHANGVMAGLSTGERVRFQVAFKPASTIQIAQSSCDREGNEASLSWTSGFRHDPCVAIRACPIVEAMAALVCLDFMLERSGDTVSSFLASFENKV